MYRHHKILAFVFFVMVSVIVYEVDVRLTEAFVSNLITFFSIVFGFYLTGVSILFGSNFSKRLRQEEDSRKNTQTKLHTLKSYFSFSSLISLLSIIILLIISLMGMTTDHQQKIALDCVSINGLPICWNQLFTALSLGLAVVNIMFMYLLFKVFFNAFLEEAR